MLTNVRINYHLSELAEQHLTPQPHLLFQKWLDDAIEKGVREPAAMVISTCQDGFPDSRVVLLKEFSALGFVFFTNYKSNKGKQLEMNGRVALNFFWPEMERQVRVRGLVARLDGESSTVYFRSRPRESQLSAWASNQSAELETRDTLETRFRYYENQFLGKEVKRPPHWGGYLVTPVEVEFWQGRPGRLHDRFRYRFSGKDWNIMRLAP